MSTHVTVAVVKPNHRAVNVYYEGKLGAQWVPEPGVTNTVSLGGAKQFLVHGTRRLVIEEVDHD